MVLFLIFLAVLSNAKDNSDILMRVKKLEIENKKQSKIIEMLYKKLEKLSKKKSLDKNEITQEQLDELGDRLDKIETSTLIDKVKLRLGFRVRNDNIEKKMADGRKVHSDNIWSTKLELNMYSKIANNMKFHGRVSMYKYWADSTIHPYALYDNMQGRVPSTSALFVERAYVDYYFHLGVPSSVTIGRQPSSDGPSYQYMENTTRKSTYSALVFDGASDGIVYTADISKIINIGKARLRVAYGKGFQNDETKIGVTNAFIGASDTSLKDTNVFGLFFESNFLGYDSSLFQVGAVKMSNVIANSMETNSSANVNLGDIYFSGAMAEVTNINNSGFDAFAHIGFSHAKPNGKLYRARYGLLNSNGSTGSKNGYAFWVGGRYDFRKFKHLKIGAEYNHGSKNWISATQGSYNVYNKLATRGDAYEIYGLYPINRFSFIRLGFLHINYNYTKSGWYKSEPKKFSDLTASEKKDAVKSINSFYLQFTVRF